MKTIITVGQDFRTKDLKTKDIKTKDIKTKDIKTKDIKTKDIKTQVTLEKRLTSRNEAFGLVYTVIYK